MKKTMTGLLALMLVATVFAGCSKGGAEPTDAVNGPASALETLETIWGKYTDDEKFPIMGGNVENPVDNAPGVYDQAYAENLTGTLVIPQNWIAKIDSAATMVHMMNANTFTAGTVHLSQNAGVEAFAADMRSALQNNQWICGTPEELLIVSLGGDYVLIAFGAADAMNPFETKLAQAYPDAKILYAEAIG